MNHVSARKRKRADAYCYTLPACASRSGYSSGGRVRGGDASGSHTWLRGSMRLSECTKCSAPDALVYVGCGGNEEGWRGGGGRQAPASATLRHLRESLSVRLSLRKAADGMDAASSGMKQGKEGEGELVQR